MSAWGGAWGSAFGASWGSTAPAVVLDPAAYWAGRYFKVTDPPGDLLLQGVPHGYLIDVDLPVRVGEFCADERTADVRFQSRREITLASESARVARLQYSSRKVKA